MTNKIQTYLKDLEREKDISILWACETGSRAWGFPSPDSDYDIRLIYVHKSDWYLDLRERKDSIERMLDNNDIDIAGWELRKSLNLLRKSNAALLERIQSSIVYHSDKAFMEELRPAVLPFYSKIATMHHYLSMAGKFEEDLRNASEYKLKKFFYTLRSALVCKWIIERDEMPPIEFEKIYRGLALDKSLVERIEYLVSMKATQSEAYLHGGEPHLLALISQCIQESHAVKDQLPSSKGELDVLSDIFRKYLKKYDH